VSNQKVIDPFLNAFKVWERSKNARRLYVVTIKIVISYTLSAQHFALDPAGMHCLAWDDAFAKQQLPAFTGQKSAFSATQGRLVAPIHVKFGRAVGRPLSLANFHANRCTGVATRPPKWQKIPPFGEKSHPAEQLDRFLYLLGAFI